MENKGAIYRDIQSVLLSREQIAQTVARMGEEITRDYEGRELVCVCILKGASVFFIDLIRHIDLPLSLDFMAVSSYGCSTQTSGVVRILKDLDHDIHDKDVLIVEDIVDSGLTMAYIKDALKSRGARSIRIATLLDKPERRKIDLPVDYTGFIVPNEFVVGYGLDYAEKYRNLPEIGILKPEIYAE